MSGNPTEPSSAEGGSQPPSLLRIKRRRGDASTDEIIIATVVPRPDPKRMRMDQILLGMTGMSLMAGTPAAEGASHGDGTQSGGGGGVVGRRQRFRLVRTVERRALEGKSSESLREFLREVPPGSSSGVERGEDLTAVPDLPLGPIPIRPSAPPFSHRLDPRSLAPPSSSSGAGGGAATSAKVSAAAAMRGLARQLSSTARYTRVKAMRQPMSSAGGAGGASSATGGPSSSEPGGGGGSDQYLFAYDFVCTDIDDGAPAAARAAAKAERRKQAQERSRRAAAEGSILMNCLPMVQEYLREAGLGELPEGEISEVAAEAATAEGGMGDEAEVGAMAEDGERGQEEYETGEDDDFVYDVYVPVEDEGGSAVEGVPVVEVEDEDDLFFGCEPTSDHDSEDSNAESYYANSYPDEDHPPGGTDSDSDDEADWCYVKREGIRPRGTLGPGEVSGERWDDEEYDLTRDSDDERDEEYENGGGRSGAGAGRKGGAHRDPPPSADAFARMLRAQARAQGRGRGDAAAAGSSQRDAGAWGYRIR